METCIDLVLQDVVRLRLVNAMPSDAAAVQRQVGLTRAESQGQADIVIRFVNEVPGQDAMRILGNWEAGYIDDAFWILRGTHGTPIAVQLPMDQVGSPCEILCHHRIPAFPFLGLIINLTALQKGFLPLHASAFVYGQQSVLVTGWTKGGKTESLLGFGEQGASYVGDEWVYIDPRDDTMRGLPQPMHVWDWHLESTQQRGRLNSAQRFKLASLRQLHRVLQPLANGTSRYAKYWRRMSTWVHGRRQIRIAPHCLFDERIQSIALCPPRVFFMASHAATNIDVVPMAVDEIVARMAVSLEHEFAGIVSCYREYRFALPERTNPLIEDLPRLLRQRLAEALQDKEGLAVWHPYPVSPQQLFLAMRAYVGDELVDQCSCREPRAPRSSVLQPSIKVAT